MTFTEFFQSIDWSPLERHGIINFRAPHYLGWNVAKSGDGYYEATRRAADATDEPAFRTESLELMARFLFGYQAYFDGLYDPEKDKKSANQLAQEYMAMRGELYDVLRYSPSQTVTGPAKILALVYRQPGSFFDFQFRQLNPGETFEGRCAVWAVGDYD